MSTKKETELTIKTVTAEEVFTNWAGMTDLFSVPADALDEAVIWAQCGHDDAYQRFGTDYLCEDCLTLIGNVLATIQYGITPEDDGTISVVA